MKGKKKQMLLVCFSVSGLKAVANDSERLLISDNTVHSLCPSSPLEEMPFPKG